MLTVSATINAPVSKVWQYYNSPEHITKWNQADSTWHCPSSVVDLRVGGKFCNTMAARDGSATFDFEGEYTQVIPEKSIKFFMPDGRHVETDFKSVSEDTTEVITRFEPETENSHDLQTSGWQSILNNFKAHLETSI